MLYFHIENLHCQSMVMLQLPSIKKTLSVTDDVQGLMCSKFSSDA